VIQQVTGATCGSSIYNSTALRSDSHDRVPRAKKTLCLSRSVVPMLSSRCNCASREKLHCVQLVCYVAEHPLERSLFTNGNLHWSCVPSFDSCSELHMSTANCWRGPHLARSKLQNCICTQLDFWPELYNDIYTGPEIIESWFYTLT